MANNRRRGRIKSGADAKSEILFIFRNRSINEPGWFLGFRETREDDPVEADLMVRFDIGEYPVAVCISDEQLCKYIAEDDYRDVLILKILHDSTNTRIHRKVLERLEREYRHRKTHVLNRPRTRT